MGEDFELVLELFEDKQGKKLKIWVRRSKMQKLGEYQCVEEENGDEEEGESNRTFYGIKRGILGIFLHKL